MKITTFDPVIITSKSNDAIGLFEELGFAATHTPVQATRNGAMPLTRMKDANGFHIEVAHRDELSQDKVIIRMNVDDFEQAHGILTAHGFVNKEKDGMVVTEHFKAAEMASPSGLTIILLEHIRK